LSYAILSTYRASIPVIHTIYDLIASCIIHYKNLLEI